MGLGLVMDDLDTFFSKTYQASCFGLMGKVSKGVYSGVFETNSIRLVIADPD